MHLFIFGLGSNMGDRLNYLRQAVGGLRSVLTEMRASSIYTSAALLPENAPPEWDQPFYNMAVSGLSAISPSAMLHHVKELERHIGRTPQGRWGPREIDIDILACDALMLDTSELTVPHAGLPVRSFALVPLAEIAPGWRWPLPGPDHGRTAAELAAALGDDTLQRIEERIAI